MKGKSQISAIVSILLCFWYLIAIVGIDVHTDHHDGKVFVVSLLMGHTDCESLHPEDVCHCVEHHHGHCHSDDEDCENEISVISLTGDGSSFFFNLAPAAVTCISTVTPVLSEVSQEVMRPCISFADPPRAHLQNLCVLRA